MGCVPQSVPLAWAIRIAYWESAVANVPAQVTEALLAHALALL